MSDSDAIILRDVSKSFRKHARSKDLRTLKSELVRFLTRAKRPQLPSTTIPAIRGISLAIPRGKTTALIGRNGSGKSTLLKLITGIYSPTAGSIEVHGRVSALLELGAGFHPDFTGRENIHINGIILGMSAREIRQRLDEIIEFSELGDFIDAPIRTYSSGMYMRLAFAVATHVDPDILIVDEILAVGDEHFARKSMAKMMEFKRSGRTIVLVTHDLATVRHWCDRAAWIDAGQLMRVGDPEPVVAEYRQAVLTSESEAREVAASGDGARKSAATSAIPSALRAVQIREVRLKGPSGPQQGPVDPAQRLEVELQYLCDPSVSEAVFSVSLRRGNGTLAYGTDTQVDKVALPKPLPSEGVLRLSFDPVCLREGEYTVEVAAIGPDGKTLEALYGLCPFTIASPIKDQGMVRPPHRWRLEPAGTEPLAAAARRRVP